MSSEWKFGQVVRWRDRSSSPYEYDPEPIGRFMVVGPSHEYFTVPHVVVVCLMAAPGTDWDIGVVLPCQSDEFEAAE